MPHVTAYRSEGPIFKGAVPFKPSLISSLPHICLKQKFNQIGNGFQNNFTKFEAKNWHVCQEKESGPLSNTGRHAKISLA